MPSSRVTDDRVELLLRELETPVQPRREFGEALLARLEHEFERSAALRPSVPRNWRPGLRILPWAMAAVVVIVATALVIARPTPVSAAQVVKRAAADLTTLPQVRATLHYDINPDGSSPGVGRGATADVEVTYVRALGYRQEIVGMSGSLPGSGGIGSIVVWDGKQLGSTWSDTRAFFVTVPRPGYDPLRELAWSSPFPDWQSICERGGSQTFDEAMIAGRSARHVRCGDLYGGFWELWVDKETGFMLKIEGALGRDDFRLGSSAKGGFEVTRIDYAFQADPALFAITPPAGARTIPSSTPPAGARDANVAASDPYAQTSLRKGEVAPLWTGQLLDGSRFRLSDARGRPLLLLLWADWCPRGDPACDVLRQYEEVSRRYAGRAAFVSVDISGGKREEARKILDDLGFHFPVVVDEDREVERTWGVTSIPTWVLLDRDGRVVEVRLKPQTVEQLQDMLRGVGL